MQTTAIAPPPKPAPPRRTAKTATLVDRVAWDAEEFEGELKDQVGRKIFVAPETTADHANGNVWYAQQDTLLTDSEFVEDDEQYGIS